MLGVVGRRCTTLALVVMMPSISSRASLYVEDVNYKAYCLALASTFLLGVAGGVIYTSITFLPAQWFPDKERGQWADSQF